MIEVTSMHKKDVLIAITPPFDIMEKRLYPNSAINVRAVTAPLSGKSAITGSTAASIGLSCGLSRAILSDGCANFLAIVLLPLIALKTTGLNRYLKNQSIIPRYNICFMMPPTFIRTAVC